jgi:hypothetical protein
MPRPVGTPARERIDPGELEPYDEVLARCEALGAPPGEAGAYYGSLLQSPPLASAISHLGSLVRTGQLRGSYTHAEREFVDMLLSREFDYYAVAPAHIPDALANGVRIEAIESVLLGDESELDESERQLAQYVRLVVNGEVTDESWDAMEQRLGTRGVLEYTVFIVFLQMTLRLMQAIGGTPNPSTDIIRTMLQDFRDGKWQLPAATARIK